MTAVNLPRGSRNSSVGNPTYWRIIDYVVTSSLDTNGLVVVAAMRCDRRSDGEINPAVIYSQLCKCIKESESSSIQNLIGATYYIKLNINTCDGAIPFQPNFFS